MMWTTSRETLVETNRKDSAMEKSEMVESTELAADDLIEEVSIDGMCGVY